jgi:GTP cyclohydrolase I
MKTMKKIRARLLDAGASFHANDNISAYLEEGELSDLQDEVEVAVANLLDNLIIDTGNDHNTCETAKRVAKMLLHETYKGRYIGRPKVTDFPNVKSMDETYIVGPIDIRSTCSHHLVPITGQAWVGVIPGSRVIGLSKFSRIIEWIMARPQIQEEATMQLADELEELIKPRALGVVLKAQHMCMTWRGVRNSETVMTTMAMRGIFGSDHAARAEFLRMIEA